MQIKKIAKGEKVFKAAVGAKIQQLMNAHEVSLSKVASATGLTAETIRQIINGTIKNPGIETLSKIAEAFSISLFQLLENRDITSQINKKKIKIIDFFDLQKNTSDKKISDLIEQSFESTEILYISDNSFEDDFFAIEVNLDVANKLTNSGMPMLKQKDLLIFSKNLEFSENLIILFRSDEDFLALGIIMEIESNFIWVKSVDIPQKQIVKKIKKENIIGAVQSVQFR